MCTGIQLELTEMKSSVFGNTLSMNAKVNTLKYFRQRIDESENRSISNHFGASIILVQPSNGPIHIHVV